eukprot:4558293-Pleurochrysis_carterae.AAC.1
MERERAKAQVAAWHPGLVWAACMLKGRGAWRTARREGGAHVHDLEARVAKACRQQSCVNIAPHVLALHCSTRRAGRYYACFCVQAREYGPRYCDGFVRFLDRISFKDLLSPRAFRRFALADTASRSRALA